MKSGTSIKYPSSVYNATKKWHNARQEHFIVITLSGSHEVIKIRTVTIGLVNKTMVHPREVFYHAIKDNATAIVFVHNHPSGRPDPSQEDQELTVRLCEAASILGFHVVDHIVVSKNGYYSFREHSILPDTNDYHSVINNRRG